MVVVVETVVGGLKFQVAAVVRIVWNCVNRELQSLWLLSRKSLEGNISNVSGCLFGGVMRADSLMECCLREVIHSIKEVVVFEMIVGVVECCLRGVIGGTYICAADSLRIDVE